MFLRVIGKRLLVDVGDVLLLQLELVLVDAADHFDDGVIFEVSDFSLVSLLL